MEGTISFIFGILTSLLGVYSTLIVIRIIFTWFSGFRYSKPVAILSRITDPYLNWWRQRFNLRAGILDLSPIVAMAVLSIAITLCGAIARRGRISLGIVLLVCLYALWSAVRFLLGFCLLIIALRLIAYFTHANIYSPFWQVVDTVSRPILYRINRIIFGKRIVRYTTGIIASIAALAALMVGGHFAMQALFVLLPGFLG